jgi:hypothetical protein
MSSASGVQRLTFIASSGTLPTRLAIDERQRPQPSPPCCRPSASRAALRSVDEQYGAFVQSSKYNFHADQEWLFQDEQRAVDFG